MWWEFQPGDRVLTAEGIFGRVTSVEDGPHPGNEHYIVELDMGLGGGEYTASELRNPDSDSVEPGFGGVEAKTSALQIREKNYRGEDGFVLSGHPPGREGGFPVSIFVKNRAAAERIREKLKADPYYQTTILDI